MLEFIWNNLIDVIATVVTACVVLAGFVYLARRPRFFLLALRNLWRNPVRTALISLATMVLVAMITMIWTIISFLDRTTQARSEDFKIIITEKWQLPSRMPMAHLNYLDPDSPQLLDDIKELNKRNGGPVYTAKDFMVWSFFGGSMDGKAKALKDMVFFFCTQPGSIKSMMDDLETLPDHLVQKLKETPNGCLLGNARLKLMNKEVGEDFTIQSLNYKNISAEFKIVGALPDVGRYDLFGIMNLDYFNRLFDQYKSSKGGEHPDMNPDRRLNLIWIRVKNEQIFNELRAIIEKNKHLFSERPIKVETASSGISSFMEAYKSILNWVKYILVPAILVIMSMVVSIAISIGVRERRSELAVMKVLGFQPNQILNMVMAESLFLGMMSGLIASLATYTIVNLGFGGIRFPIAFFPSFNIPLWSIAWGIAMGALAAFFGSVIPAWNARSVTVSEVFSKIA